MSRLAQLAAVAMLAVTALQADRDGPDRVVVSEDGRTVITWDCANYRSALELAEKIAGDIANGKSIYREGV